MNFWQVGGFSPDMLPAPSPDMSDLKVPTYKGALVNDPHPFLAI